MTDELRADIDSPWKDILEFQICKPSELCSYGDNLEKIRHPIRHNGNTMIPLKILERAKSALKNVN